MEIDIGLCTFRRTHVAETLRSLSQLAITPGWKIRVIIADNDEAPSAQELIEATARACGLEIHYVHAPARNISLARNACLDAAAAPLLAFIDDDELASPGWLQALAEEMARSEADVVLGPVRAVYPHNAPAWAKHGDFHSTQPVWVGDEIVTGYTCNVLLRRLTPPLQDRRFRLEFGRSGGEDTEFFAAVKRAGGRISYAHAAIVNEAIAPERISLKWLLQRRFRAGQTHGFLLMEKSNSLPNRIGHIGLASLKTSFCFVAALLSIFSAARSRSWLLRGALHAGVVSFLLGIGTAELYGRS